MHLFFYQQAIKVNLQGFPLFQRLLVVFWFYIFVNLSLPFCYFPLENFHLKNVILKVGFLGLQLILSPRFLLSKATCYDSPAALKTLLYHKLLHTLIVKRLVSEVLSHISSSMSSCKSSSFKICLISNIISSSDSVQSLICGCVQEHLIL